jgi:hypothetical protein
MWDKVGFKNFDPKILNIKKLPTLKMRVQIYY